MAETNGAYAFNCLSPEPKIMVTRHKEDMLKLILQKGHGVNKIGVGLGHIAGDHKHIVSVRAAG